MKTERVKNSVYNGFSNLIVSISITILSFILRTVFIKKLGEQCLGLDGLFSNILSLLSLAELGFGSAISFSLYDPLAKNNTKKISQLMSYFKNVYKKIAYIILIVGLCLLPFLHNIVKEYTISDNIYLIYLLYLVNTVSTYFISYSSVLIEADQKLYKLTAIKLIFNLFTYGFQLILLLILNNFILYLIIQFIFRLIERIIINNYIKKKYPDINFNLSEKIDDKSKNKILKNIKGIIFHKVGNYAVNGTDNILISSIINISTTGIYSNYLSFVSIFRNLINGVISATTASFGNLNVTETSETKKNVFDMVNFLCYFATGFILIGIYFCINSFIIIWIGAQYTFNIFCVSAICLNFYLDCLMIPVNTVKSSAGLYYIDRYIPIIQSIINLVISIVFGIKFGIIGILLGTSISSILTVNITKPYIIHKHIFKTSCLDYFLKIIKNILTILITIVICSYIFKLINLDGEFIKIVVYGLISTIIYTLIFLSTNFYSKEFKYFKNILIKKHNLIKE